MPSRRWDRSKPPTGPFTLNKDCFQAQGLVAWYPLGGASGGLYVPDLSGNLHLTGVAPFKQVIGDKGQPVGEYDGAAAMLFASATPTTNATPLSVSAWINPTSVAGSMAIISWGSFAGTTATRSRYQFDHNVGGLRFISAGASTTNIASKSGVLANTWQHTLGIEESNTSRYAAVNGVIGAQDATMGTLLSTWDRTQIGANFDGSVVSNYATGKIGEICFWNVNQKNNAIALADPATRFELWYPLRSRKWFTAGAGGDPALTNNLATTAAGTVVPSTSLVLTGNAATASAGTVAPDISLALTGNGATTAAGDVAVAGADPALTGSTATSSVGDVSPGITIALAGNGATASVGDVSPAISLALSGLAGTSAAGIVVPGLDLATTGNTATSAVGNVSPGGDVTLALTGNAATASAGTLSIGGPLTDAEFRQMYDWLQDLYGRQLLTVGTYIALK